MPPLPSIRLTFLLLFLGCTSLILVGMYMEHLMDLEPCPLCITQRVFIISVGVIGLIGFIANFQGKARRVVASFGLLFAVAGGGFSTRQLWLQSLPEDQVPACGPGVSYLLDNFPLIDALSVLLRGDGNCAEVVWTLFGISIPGWTLMAFACMAVLSIWQILRKNTAR